MKIISDGRTTRVLLEDGTDISKEITKVTWSCDASKGEMARCELTLTKASLELTGIPDPKQDAFDPDEGEQKKTPRLVKESPLLVPQIQVDLNQFAKSIKRK